MWSTLQACSMSKTSMVYDEDQIEQIEQWQYWSYKYGLHQNNDAIYHEK